MQAGGFALAAVATLAVFLTDNPQLLRVAVVAVAWAFVLATFAAGRRGTDRVAAAAREAELRRAYELELEREVSARREYELELENELRRESEDAMRYELDALRGDIASLAGLRDEVARVSELRGDLTALASLRDEVARVAALRDDVAALTSMRQELGQLSELRADMGRLRAELTEQLSSEMLVERIVMRTQASRLPADPGPARPVDSGGAWTDDVPPRELTGGWPAVRLDEPRDTQHFEQVRAERTSWEPATAELRSWDAPAPSWETPETSAWTAGPLSPPVPPTSTFPAAPPASAAPAPPPPAYRPPPPPPVVPEPWSFARHETPAAEPRLWSATDPSPGRADEWRTTAEPAPAPPTAAFPMSPPPRSAPPQIVEPPSPLEWLAARSLLDPTPTSRRPDVPPLRRRDDVPPVDLAAAPTTQRPAVPSGPPPVRVDDRGGYRVAVRDQPPHSSGPVPGQEKRIDEILAENGVSPATGGRRRRRYRDEGEPDDVLARVLGRN